LILSSSFFHFSFLLLSSSLLPRFLLPTVLFPSHSMSLPLSLSLSLFPPPSPFLSSFFCSPVHSDLCPLSFYLIHLHSPLTFLIPLDSHPSSLLHLSTLLLRSLSLSILIPHLSYTSPLSSFLISPLPSPAVSWVVIGFPILIIGSKILLLLPPISWRLASIRRGENHGALYACKSVRSCCKGKSHVSHATEMDLKSTTYNPDVEGKTMG
jgi:hypothetical protein